MRDASLIDIATLHRAGRYRVELLADAEVCENGVVHGAPGSRERLAWSAIFRAVAAEVGEPEGVRTVIFDLVVGREAGFAIRRFDAEPGEDAMRVAERLLTALGSDAVSPSIKTLASEGSPGIAYPDLEEFEAVALALLDERGGPKTRR
jgi:hypothetical protein